MIERDWRDYGRQRQSLSGARPDRVATAPASRFYFGALAKFYELSTLLLNEATTQLFEGYES